jgi:hypothetical protein
VWSGDRDDEAEFGTGAGISVRLTPRLDPGSWQDETRQTFPLRIDVEVLIPGTDADDPINFQGAVEAALYQPGNRSASEAFQKSLTDLGALEGLIDFMPVNDPGARARKDGNWYAVGQLKIDVTRTLNP